MPVSITRITPVAALMFVLTGLLSADQQDPVLDRLFLVLQETEDPQLLVDAENRIWQTWLAHADSNAESIMSMATGLLGGGHYADALALFNGLIRRYPDYAEAWNKRATAHYLTGNLDASLEDIRQTLLLEPRHFGALSGLGLIHLQRNEFHSARDAFERVLALHPHSQSAAENLQLVIRMLDRSVI